MKVQIKWNSGAKQVINHVEKLTEFDIAEQDRVMFQSENEDVAWTSLNLADVHSLVIKGGGYKNCKWVDTQGRWIDCDPKGDDGLVYRCNICGTLSDRESNYCPNCGSFMKESQETL